VLPKAADIELETVLQKRQTPTPNPSLGPNYQMKDQRLLVREANLDESDVVAAVARRSREHFLPYLPDLHTFEEDKLVFRNVVFIEDHVWVAEEEGKIVGFCAFKEEWLDHLYFLPSHVGKTLGSALLKKAKQTYSHLQLWTFQQNTRAISFYHRHGFVKTKETDGSECEERIPDALFEWRKS
jgi:ribosomal protein S18 acetylase RimI-like enzyme